MTIEEFIKSEMIGDLRLYSSYDTDMKDRPMIPIWNIFQWCWFFFINYRDLEFKFPFNENPFSFENNHRLLILLIPIIFLFVFSILKCALTSFLTTRFLLRRQPFQIVSQTFSRVDLPGVLAWEIFFIWKVDVSNF